MKPSVFNTIEVNGKQHVVVEVERGPKSPVDINYKHVQQPDYKGSGMALCGILKKRETLYDFKARYKPVGNNPKPRKKAS